MHMDINTDSLLSCYASLASAKSLNPVSHSATRASVSLAIDVLAHSQSSISWMCFVKRGISLLKQKRSLNFCHTDGSTLLSKTVVLEPDNQDQHRGPQMR